MKSLFTIILLIAFKVASADVIDDVAVAFKAGNSKALAAYFSTTVELSVLNTEEIYSRAQAELILKDFFQKNPPKGVKVIHKVVSNANYKFGVISMVTAKDNFRVSYELKNNAGKFLINQIRIEAIKE